MTQTEGPGSSKKPICIVTCIDDNPDLLGDIWLRYGRSLLGILRHPMFDNFRAPLKRMRATWPDNPSVAVITEVTP